MNKNIFLIIILISTVILSVALVGFIMTRNQAQTPNVAGVSKDTREPEISSMAATLSINQSTISGQISESEQLVNSFYRFYINCLNQAGECSIKNRPDLDYGQLMEKTSEVKGVDRILCAQNIPKFFQIDHSSQDENGVESVYIVETFESGLVQLIVEVQKNTGTPKIVNVICPRP
jgi:hypothetical protein